MTETKDGIHFIFVENPQEGEEKAKEILYETLGYDWVLFLSGGKTPLSLYQKLAEERMMSVGAVAQVDERFGPPLHEISNELAIKKTEFLDYLSEEYIPFHGILKEGLDRTQTSEEYNKTVEKLLEKYEKRFAILGAGVDGHTAGIAPNRADFVNPLFDQPDLLVGQFEDPVPMSASGSPEPPNGFGERITLTINALSQKTALLFMVFGENKRKSLEMMFEPGPVEECPIRFVTDPEISKKTLFITDIKV